jgi:hypothetical protein
VARDALGEMNILIKWRKGRQHLSGIRQESLEISVIRQCSCRPSVGYEAKLLGIITSLDASRLATSYRLLQLDSEIVHGGGSCKATGFDR